MGIMGIQQKIAWFSVERSRTLYGMESWSGSLHRNGFGKQISKDTYHWKEIEKVSRHAEPRRRDQALREGRYGDREEEQRNAREVQRPLQNQEVVREIHTIFGGITGGGESNSARKAYARSMQGEVYSLHRPMKAAKMESVVLSFLEEDARGVVMPHDDALVVTVTVANHAIHRILVDNGSLADILYWPAFQQMGIERDRIKPFGSPLVGFGREQVQPIGIILLPVTAGTAPRLSTVMVDFLVVDRPSAYNAIIGRPALNKLKSCNLDLPPHDEVPTEEGVGEVRGDQLAARRCYNISMKKVSDRPLSQWPRCRGQRGTSRATRGGGCRRRKSPADRDLSHPGGLRRPHGLPPQEYGGVRLVTCRHARDQPGRDCPRFKCGP
jgi:hypothetical protein